MKVSAGFRILVLLCISVWCALTANAQATDRIFFNGIIYTCNDEQPEADAVAIRGDKILAVGTLEQVSALASTNAFRHDLKGKCLLPGLIDAHNHAIKGGERLLTAHLADELLSADDLATYARTALETGRGRRGNALYITGVHSAYWSDLSLLDSIFNNGHYGATPVMLLGSDGHTAWANQAALEQAGVTKAFLSKLPGSARAFYGRTPNGDANGFISETAITHLDTSLGANSVSEYEAAVAGIRHLNGLGITAWLDPSVDDINDSTAVRLDTYIQTSINQTLTAHVAATVVAHANDAAIPQIIKVKELEQRANIHKNLRVIGFKIFADGVLEFPTQTAAISRPYANSGKKGSLLVTPALLNRFVLFADQNDELVHIHAIGDRAVSVSLDAFAHTRRAQSKTDIPHSITHLQIVRPSDFDRFKKLCVLPVMQLLWATADRYTVELVKPYIHSELYEYHYPANALAQAGATICGASDWPVSSANPFEAMAIAETRKGDLGVLTPAQRVDRATMLNAYTVNAAKAMLMEGSIGSIEPGKQADLIVVDRDVMKVDAGSLADTRVLCTMFGGEIVFGSYP